MVHLKVRRELLLQLGCIDTLGPFIVDVGICTTTRSFMKST